MYKLRAQCVRPGSPYSMVWSCLGSQGMEKLIWTLYMKKGSKWHLGWPWKGSGEMLLLLSVYG
ncbi:hypothetical protein DY000_02032399 [Brassica cretica]|uniref:Uncharacterized protein n=1 Tax=Brassica cretica TaxID=69181 RepID=A0ABQ7DWG2_BRACR|nr:hypothetical protein DY000_02032399 [Brassica cretica]